jgi:NADH-quinone oxidoreductase subunit G
MSNLAKEQSSDLVNITIDGNPVQVKKGTNIIEAAKEAGIDIPHYCYHPDLSVAGNCRMCQISVKGAPKLTIACNTPAAEGMEVQTHHTSKDVADAQAATLEFILINHPLDCTVCDQAGHCKLQDYHFEYNARASRFVEEKVHKVKALPLGPNVMLDGERCIMCTRCIRFCDEVTKTSELGMINRGDQSVIAVSPGRELDNPLSGSVVDLCPVGALTHRKWRFNTRIWYTKQTHTICTGCSTGCNVKVAERDGQVVLVKGRRNDAVNKEWLCDDGRYGFNQHLPQNRILTPYVNTDTGREKTDVERVLKALSKQVKTLTVILSPHLLLEEYYLLKQFLVRVGSSVRTVMAYRTRTLSDVEKILVSPDRAGNFRGAQVAGLIGSNPEQSYEEMLGKIRRKEIDNVLILGDRAFCPDDVDAELLEGIKAAALSVGLFTDAASMLSGAVSMVVPGRSLLEQSGLLVNRRFRLQYAQAVTEIRDGTTPTWRFIAQLAHLHGMTILEGDPNVLGDREITRWYLSSDPMVASQRLTIGTIKDVGVQLEGFDQEPDSHVTQSGVSEGAPTPA